MNFKYQLFTLVVALAFLAGCATDPKVAPNSSELPEIEEFFGSGPDRPVNICGSSVMKNLENSTNDVLGEIEIVNDRDDLYLIVSLYHDWALEKLDLFVGRRSNIPMAGSSVNTEAFEHNFNFGRPVNSRNFKLPLATLTQYGGAYDLGIHAVIAQMDLFGSTFNRTEVWMKGDRVGDGYVIAHSTQTCSVIPGNNGPNNN